MLLFQNNTAIVKIRTIREFIINNHWNNSRDFLFSRFTSSWESCIRVKFQFFRLLYLERLGGKFKQKVLSRIVNSERKTETNFFSRKLKHIQQLNLINKIVFVCSIRVVLFIETCAFQRMILLHSCYVFGWVKHQIHLTRSEFFFRWW